MTQIPSTMCHGLHNGVKSSFENNHILKTLRINSVICIFIYVSGRLVTENGCYGLNLSKIITFSLTSSIFFQGLIGAALKCAPIMEWEFILASGRSSF